MMRRSSLGGRRRASCALDRSRADAIICSTVCRSIRGACTSPVRTGSSSVRSRAARASELTDNLTAFAVSSMAPSTMAPSSIVVPKVRVLAACPFANFRCSAFSSTQFQKASPSFRGGARSSSAARIAGRFRIRDQLKVDSDKLERLAVGVLHVRQGRIESPAEHVVEPQIAEHECRSGENFIHTGHEPEGAIVNVPPKRTRKLHRLGARFLPHSFDRRHRFFSELMGEGQHAAGDCDRPAIPWSNMGGWPAHLRPPRLPCDLPAVLPFH